MNPKLNPNDRVTIPMSHHPLFVVEHAIQKGVEKNILFKVWGGLGDRICAEPTLRHALSKFKDCKISIATEQPELFSHLSFHESYNLTLPFPKIKYEDYLVFTTITPPDDSNMVWLFFSHMLTNCVDFPSMCALRLQLPVADKEIQLPSIKPANISSQELFNVVNGVLVHPGRHWQSKTFPKSFWDKVLAGLRASNITPVLIGAETDDNRGTVNVDTEGCVDLRGKLSILESIWACKRAAVVLTNDSSPLHMAASGDAYIGYIATCKHYDLITHWRNGEWQWREKNFGKGGIWETVNYCPNNGETVEVEFVDPKLLESWLPNPYEMVHWTAEMREKMLLTGRNF